jgi:hypothetical protein
LAALTMAYSVNVDRITADYQKQVELRNATDSLRNSEASAWAALQDQYKLDLSHQQEQTNSKGKEVDSLQNERIQLIKDKSDAVNARDEVMNKIDQLAATNKTQALLIESYRNEVTKLREQEIKYHQHETELVDRVNDLESQREVLEGSVRALQENLEEAKRTIANGPNTGGNQAKGPIRPSFPISATIVQTATNKATGKAEATINVGTNNQIRENMQLVILSKEGKYLADFLVTQADLQWAKGEIDARGAVDANGKPVEIKAGDIVRSLVSR